VSEESKEMIRTMLERNPKKRIELKDVLQYPIFINVQGKLGTTLEESDKKVACLRK